MINVFLTSAGLVAVCLMGSSLLSDGWANRNAKRFRQVITQLAWCQLALALSCAVARVASASPVYEVALSAWHDGPGLKFYYDGTASLMFLLVSFVGWIICHFSIRYLDGDRNQGRYYRWTAFTIGAVMMMVLSGSLVMFVVFWMLTSMGLHHLLLHYPDRAGAQRAAWSKFVVSRVGDLMLIAAIVILYRQFHTSDFAELFSRAGTAEPHSAALWLLMLGAVLKSAQFPFHTWLPQTLDTPTPVSALMHAGIVNAGGYLIIRMSPMFAQAPAPLLTLTLIGCITAVFGSLVMMTQPSIKRALAYSTIAQMGFMMLQCGLGAFSAAMLHILAHSLYKAHAFLSCGNVIAQRTATSGSLRKPLGRSLSRVHALVLIAAVTATCWVSLTFFGLSPASKPGGIALVVVLSLALFSIAGQALQTGSGAGVTLALSLTTGLTVAYAASYLLISTVVDSNPYMIHLPSSAASVAIVVVSFAAIFVVQQAIGLTMIADGLKALYVHTSNGFYLDSLRVRTIELARSYALFPSAQRPSAIYSRETHAKF